MVGHDQIQNKMACSNTYKSFLNSWLTTTLESLQRLLFHLTETDISGDSSCLSGSKCTRSAKEWQLEIALNEKATDNNTMYENPWPRWINTEWSWDMEVLAYRDSGWEDPTTFAFSFFVLAIVDVLWRLSGVAGVRKEEEGRGGKPFSCTRVDGYVGYTWCNKVLAWHFKKKTGKVFNSAGTSWN